MKSIKLKIITLNCFDSPLSLNRIKRINKLISEILILKPDILCLQEITFSKTAYKLKNIFELNELNVLFNDDSVFNRGGLFVASSFPILKAEFDRFKDQGPLLSFQVTDRVMGKGFQKTTLLIDHKEVVLFNVHFACVYNNNSVKETETLRNQCNQLVNTIKKEKGDVIVCGDFNFSPVNEQYLNFLSSTKLIDSANASLVTVSMNNTNRQGLYKIGANLKLDYIFISSNLSRDIGSQVVFDDLFNVENRRVHLSDHFGLLTRLNV